MTSPNREPVDRAFLEFQKTGSPRALAQVFDVTAAELLRVATHLTGNPQDAEDLVQETFLVAIEKRDAYVAGDAGVLPWLLGVLGNRARRRHRQPPRPIAPQGRPTAAPNPLQAAAATELDAAVSDAIAKLPASYRPVLNLHLRNGLTAAEIALALERPPGTVRTQLVRGLELMRRQLPRGVASALGLLPLSSPGLVAIRDTVLHAAASAAASAAPPIAAGTLIAGVLTMKKTIVGIAGIAVLALGTAAWWNSGDAHADRLPEEPIASLTGDPGNPPLPPTPSAAPESFDTDAPTTARAALAPADAATHGSLTVQVRWAHDGTPAVGATVGTISWGQPNALLHRQKVATDTLGRAVFDRVAAGELDVRTDTQRKKIELVAGKENRAELTVTRFATATGRVVDHAGAPVAGARVLRTGYGNWSRTVEVAQSDAEGRFTIDLFGESHYLGASHPDYAQAHLISIDAARGDTRTLELRLRGPGNTLRGVVTDTEGRPVPFALVRGRTGGIALSLDDGTRATQAPVCPVRTDARGAFVLDSLEPGPQTFMARAPGYALWTERLDITPEDRTEVQIVLQPAATLSGVVTDTDGRPVEGATIAYGRYGDFDSGRTQTDAAGHYELPDIPSGQLAMSAAKKDLGKAQETLSFEPGSALEWSPRLDAGKVIRGRVVDADGAPLAGWTVNARSYDWIVNGSQDWLQSKTGPDGRFVLRNAKGERYSLTATPAGAPLFAGARRERVAPGDDVEITILEEHRPTAYLRGTVRGPLDATINDLGVTLWRDNVGASHGIELNPETGDFRIGPVAPGPYDLSIQVGERPAKMLEALQLASHQTLDVGVVRLDTPVRVALVIIPGEENAFPNGDVGILTASGRHLLNVRAKDGEAPVIELVPGRYNAQCGAGIRPFEVHAGRPDGAPVTIEVRPNQGTRHRIDISTAQPSTSHVTLDVFDADGALFSRSHCGGGKPRKLWPGHAELPAGRSRIVAHTTDSLRGELQVDSPPISNAPLEIVLR